MKKLFNKIKKQQDLASHKDESYIADSKLALMTKTTPFAHIILYIIILLLIVLLIWAYFGKIDQITVASAKVVPSTQVKVIQSLDGGIIVKIFVKEGDMVKTEQPLVQLDETRYSSDYQSAYEKYLALSALVARLSAEAANQDEINFPEELKNYPEITQRQLNEFQTRRNALKSELDSLQHTYDISNQQLSILSEAVKTGIVTKLQYLQSQRETNEVKTRILQRQDDYKQDVWNQLNQNKAELAIVTKSLTSLRDKMQHTTIRSPVEGIVKKVNVTTVGGVILPGMTIMEIVPIEDTLLVEAQVSPKDIAFVRVGQPANVKFTAYDYSIYGELSGKVEYVSADSIEDTRATLMGKPNVYYAVNVRTGRNYLGSEKHKLPILPGMMGTVYIQTGQKTVLQYILKPLIKAKEEALRER